MKICFKCNKPKAITEFYKHSAMADGVVGKCKECNKKDVKENYDKNREHYSDYEQKRNQNVKRRGNKLKYQNKHRKNNPEKNKARAKVARAIKSGKLKRLPCELCGNEKSQAHHHDYNLPLDVRWLCFKCHREKEHGQIVTQKDC